MNTNSIVNNGWSNQESKKLYTDHWPHEPALFQQYQNGDQCGACAFFAKLDADWGLCCRAQSRHHLETVLEHFTCAALIREGWGPHSFTEHAEFHCRCHGEPLLPG